MEKILDLKKFSAEEYVSSNAAFETEKGVCGSRKGTRTLPHEHICIFLDQEGACSGKTTRDCDELERTRKNLETLSANLKSEKKSTYSHRSSAEVAAILWIGSG